MKKELNTTNKLCYSISEVAQLFDVNESLLRHWEKEFETIKPRKTATGIRSYRKEDIEAIEAVYHLVKERKMTLSGAKELLKKNKKGVDRVVEVRKRLLSIKDELQQIAAELHADDKNMLLQDE